ncbi:hypothetical protein ACRRTK_021480 [Alexandromys fortis]
MHFISSLSFAFNSVTLDSGQYRATQCYKTWSPISRLHICKLSQSILRTLAVSQSCARCCPSFLTSERKLVLFHDMARGASSSCGALPSSFFFFSFLALKSPALPVPQENREQKGFVLKIFLESI